MTVKKRTILILVFFTVFAFSAGTVIYRTMQYNEATYIYDEAVALAEIPDMTEAPEMDESAQTSQEDVWVNPYADAFESMDFGALKEVNDDVIGWINIPGTVLSYPLLQGDDNDYYLDHTWNGSKNASGAIFMEHRSSADLSDFNTIIYGHRMGNSTMFGSLSKYSKQSYWESNPLIYISNETGSHAYLVFAAYEADVSQDTFRLVFEDKKEQQALIDIAVSSSVIDTDIVPTTENKILTLSTCTGLSDDSDTRWVVQAVQVELVD